MWAATAPHLYELDGARSDILYELYVSDERRSNKSAKGIITTALVTLIAMRKNRYGLFSSIHFFSLQLDLKLCTHLYVYILQEKRTNMVEYRLYVISNRIF